MPESAIMLPRQAAMLARSRAVGFSRAFSGTGRCMKRVAIDEQSNDNDSPYTTSTSSPRSSLAMLRQEAEKMRSRDLPLLNPQADETVDEAGSEAEASPENSDTSVSPAIEEEVQTVSSLDPPSALVNAVLKQTLPPRRAPGQRNPFEKRSSLQVTNSGTGLRERSRRTEALQAASASFGGLDDNMPKQASATDRDDYSLLSDSPAPEGVSSDIVEQSAPSNTSQSIDDLNVERRPMRSQGREARRQARDSQMDVVGRSNDAELVSDRDKTEGKSAISKSNVVDGHMQSSRAMQIEEADPKDDVEIQMTRPEAATISSYTRPLPRSVRSNLDRELLEKASSAQWLPFNPTYVDGQREGCAEAGFESWTVFTKIRSDGLRTRLFARRILASTHNCLTFMTALNASFQQSGGTPDSIFYRSINGKRGSVQVEIAGNLYDKSNDEEYDDHILFRMYPDVSQEQIRVIRQINSVLDACQSGSSPNRQSQTASSTGQKKKSIETGEISESSVKRSEGTLQPRLETRKEESKTNSKDRMRIIPIETKGDRYDTESSRRRTERRGDGDDLNRQASSGIENRSRQTKASSDDSLSQIPSEFGLSSNQRRGRSPKSNLASRAERDALWRALRDSLTRPSLRDNVDGEDGSFSKPSSISIPSFVRSAAKDGSKVSKGHNKNSQGKVDRKDVISSTGKDISSSNEFTEASKVDRESLKAADDKPIEDATPVAIDGDQAESNKDKDSIRPNTSSEDDEVSGGTKSSEAPEAIEESTPVLVDGDQAKGTESEKDVTSTESSAAASRGDLEKQAIDSSKEITNQDASAKSSSEGSLEEATPVFVDGEQAKDTNDEHTSESKPASIGDIQSDSTWQASDTSVHQGEAKRPSIDASDVDEAVKKREETNDKVEEAVKESPLGVVRGRS